MNSTHPQYPIVFSTALMIPPTTVFLILFFMDTSNVLIRLFLAFAVIMSLPQILILIVLSPLLLAALFGLRLIFLALLEYGYGFSNEFIGFGVASMVVLGHIYLGCFLLGYLIHRVNLKHAMNQKLLEKDNQEA